MNTDAPNETEQQKEKDLKENETPEAEVENTGMDMGTTFKEDQEQDLDDLIHSRGTLKKDEIPPPEEA